LQLRAHNKFSCGPLAFYRTTRTTSLRNTNIVANPDKDTRRLTLNKIIRAYTVLLGESEGDRKNQQQEQEESLQHDGKMQEEKEEKQLRQAEMEVKKGQNLIEHEEEIYSRPARTWFQTGKEKAKAEARSKEQYEAGFNAGKGKEKKTADDKPKRDKFAGLSRRVKRRKMAMEEDEGAADSVAIRSAVRSAKKAARPKKIGEPESRQPRSKKAEKKSKRKASARASRGFEKDLGQRTTTREGVRAKKGDVIGGMGKKKGGRRKTK